PFLLFYTNYKQYQANNKSNNGNKEPCNHIVRFREISKSINHKISNQCIAAITSFNNLFSSRLCTPSRTTINFFDGMMYMFCPPKPSAKNKSAGTSGNRRWVESVP